MSSLDSAFGGVSRLWVHWAFALASDFSSAFRIISKDKKPDGTVPPLISRWPRSCREHPLTETCDWDDYDTVGTAFKTAGICTPNACLYPAEVLKDSFVMQTEAVQDWYLRHQSGELRAAFAEICEFNPAPVPWPDNTHVTVRMNLRLAHSLAALLLFSNLEEGKPLASLRKRLGSLSLGLTLVDRVAHPSFVLLQRSDPSPVCTEPCYPPLVSSRRRAFVVLLRGAKCPADWLSLQSQQLTRDQRLAPCCGGRAPSASKALSCGGFRFVANLVRALAKALLPPEVAAALCDATRRVAGEGVVLLTSVSGSTLCPACGCRHGYCYRIDGGGGLRAPSDLSVSSTGYFPDPAGAEAAKALVAALGSCPIVMVGHSLGAAVGTFGILHLTSACKRGCMVASAILRCMAIGGFYKFGSTVGLSQHSAAAIERHRKAGPDRHATVNRSASMTLCSSRIADCFTLSPGLPIGECTCGCRPFGEWMHNIYIGADFLGRPSFGRGDLGSASVIREVGHPLEVLGAENNTGRIRGKSWERPKAFSIAPAFSIADHHLVSYLHYLRHALELQVHGGASCE